MDRLKEDVADCSGWRAHPLNVGDWFNKLSLASRGSKQAVGFLTDLILVVVSLWIAGSISLGFTDKYGDHGWSVYGLLPLLTVAVFSALGVYRWVVRSTNRRLFRQLLEGSLASALCLLALLLMFSGGESAPWVAVPIYAVTVTLSTFSVRLVWKWGLAAQRRGMAVAIYGAGAAGQQLAILLDLGDQYRPVVFVDDDAAQAGATVCGLPVLVGDCEDLGAQFKRRKVVKVVFAIPSLSAADYQQKIVEMEKLGTPVLTMLGIGELVAGQVTLGQCLEVSISDILGRQEVLADPVLMREPIARKTVLVTGGGGSIGSELCRQIVSLRPERLIVLDNCEVNLYHITEESSLLCIQAEGTEKPVFTPVLGSVTDSRLLRRIFGQYAIDIVFHAAAYKHVPIIEAHPEQGVLVNVFGTQKVMEAALQHGVSNFLLVSTDKAVRPTNAMGASKRVAELVLQAKAAQCDHMRISMVRFGNVLGSSGSVVPKFERQIRSGGPLTLTHADITRYFMTIPEAAQLVIQASAIASGGEVFVLDMGEPVRIEDLARTMVLLSGRKIKNDTGRHGDIEILESGLRPGEKMYEELFESPDCLETGVPGILFAREGFVTQDALNRKLSELKRAAIAGDPGETRRLLLSLAAAPNSLATPGHKFCGLEGADV